MRSFLAVELPADLRRGLGAVAAGLADRFPSVRWVREESLHLTLRFLGEVPEASLSDLTADLRSGPETLRRFEFEVRGVGCFPDRGAPRVVWAGVGEGADRLIRMAARIEPVAARIGREAGTRRFRPHLTLGRVRGKLDGDLRGALSRFDRQLWGRVPVCDYVLMESRLSPAGARYRVVERFPLGPGE